MIRLEVGKRYMTYGGDIVKVVYIMSNPILEYSGVVAICTKSIYEVVLTYPLNGEWLGNKEHENNIKMEL